MQTFRVFFNDGTSKDVDADTYGRDATDWVLYDSIDIDNAGTQARFPSADVSAIAIVKAEGERLVQGIILDRTL